MLIRIIQAVVHKWHRRYQEAPMSRELDQLIERARQVRMTEREVTAQRRSFAYGNAAFENPVITPEMVAEEDIARRRK